MAELLIVAHDAGGANILAALAPHLTDMHRLTWCGAGPALALWHQAGLMVTPVDDAVGIEAGLAKVPDLVITGTSAVADIERWAWTASRRRNVASFAVIDAWMNYRRRATMSSMAVTVLPDAVAVADAAMRRGLADDGLSPARIYEVGQPHLEALVSRLANRRGSRARNIRPLLVFFSEGIREQYDFGCRPGYDQFSAMSLLVEALQPGFELELAILPHPLEGIALWQSFLAKVKPSERVIVTLGGCDRDAALCAADGILGMTSMVLVEAALLGIPVLSLQPERIENGNPMLDAFPGIALVTDPAGLAGALDRFLSGLARACDVPILPVIVGAASWLSQAIEDELALAKGRRS